MVGLYWKRANATGAFSSMITAVVVGLISEFFLAGKVAGILGMPSNILASLVGLAVLVIVSLATAPPTEDKIAFLNS